MIRFPTPTPRPASCKRRDRATPRRTATHAPSQARPRWISAALRVAIGLAAASLLPALARLPEPDAILHGTITLDGIVVTATRTDILLEARRAGDGTVLASYRMGSEPAAGNRYVLRIPLEALTPPLPPHAAALGETVNIQVRSTLQLLTGQVQTLAERGQIRRIDFHVGNAPDNGLPDDWEIIHFGAAGQDPDADPDSDGRSTRQEFESGTNPVRGDDVLALAAESAPGGPRVSFLARRAEGAGYSGRTRRFTLEAGLTADGSWAPVPGYSNLTGNGQIVTYTTPPGGSAAFFRLRATLD